MIPNGGLDTTLKGRQGSRRRALGANDRDSSYELIPQVPGALWVQLNRDNARTDSNERASYRSGSCTNVKNKFTR